MLVQWIGFLHASGLFGNPPTEKFYDIFGSLTFVLILCLSISLRKVPSTRQKLAVMAALIWAVRLGWFLFTRIMKNNGIDSRFTEIKREMLTFLIAWTIQGAWVFTTILSILMMNMSTDTSRLNILDFTGICLWIIGFAFECIADFQKQAFRKNPSNKNKWISSGLWAYSRHPNYFGEILLWFGMSLMAYSAMKTRTQRLSNFIPPFFVATLIIFVSGIPKLEERADSQFGKIEEYRRYKTSTSTLIPILGRKGDAPF
ncbi:hypothetical protein OCOL_001584 [Ordospora colligata]